jgi:hypothetical protein
VAESRSRLASMTDDALETALRDLATAVAFPSSTRASGPDLAMRVRVRIASEPLPTRGWRAGRPLRRGLVLALAALLVLAAIVGAVGLGLPGIRIIFGEGTPPPARATPGSGGPSGSLGPIGSTLGLGTSVSLADGERLAGLDALLPSAPDLGEPDAVFVAHERIALVWRSGATLPTTSTEGVGLLLNEFRGDLSDGYFEKILGEDSTVTPVTVAGSPGYWISGPPHYFMYVDANGEIVDDSHRAVGDTLIWTTGDLTFRLESSLAMDEAIRLAESLR